MKVETIIVALLAREVAAKCKSVFPSSSSASYKLIDNGVMTGEECCALCASTAHCGAFAFTVASRCYTAKDSGTCIGSSRAARISHVSGGSSSIKYVGNGACGQALRLSSSVVDKP
ncbi:hypothetical protein M426DRAFT_9749 [Hypoxylon sp. CI-4A]|nr:hypothetical protein M426DRAFT_9749 [Hypoxylon sp. CI-4A]